MKYLRFMSILMLAAMAIIFAGCQSKEEKAAELIKEELSKTLYDFESYQPIETTVKEAKFSVFNDTLFWLKGHLLAYTMKKANEYIEKAKEAESRMELWGPPTAYTSSYSDKQYYKYEEEREEAQTSFLSSIVICKSLADIVKDSILQCDTSMVIGWEVFHRFRCKTKGGHSTIADYRYVIDKDFKKIILREDKDDDDDKETRNALELVMSGEWDDIDISGLLE